MGIYGIKPRFRRSLEPIARRLDGASPDAISYAAVVFAAIAGVALALAPTYRALLLVAPILFFVRIACNALDGMVAQAQGSASARGEIVNELSDRISDALIFGGLALGGLARPALAWGILVVTLLVSYVGILSKAVGARRNYDGPMGKADRMLLLGVASIVAYVAPSIGVTPGDAMDAFLALGILLGLVTLARRTRAASREAGGA